MKRLATLLLLAASPFAAAQETTLPKSPAQEASLLRRTAFGTADSLRTDAATDAGLLERLRNMPNLEVGRGITFRPKNDWFELTMRFRMQNLLALSFDEDFTLTKTDARVKRLRLRFDGYIYSPKLVYSVQLGFTGYDAETLPNGSTNIVRDAIVYYVPNAAWNIGFGQTKIKANRARINSSSALQFVDRSIVNSEFNLDRDFGLFGEYNPLRGEGFNLSAKDATGVPRRAAAWPTRGAWSCTRWDASERRATCWRAISTTRSGCASCWPEPIPTTTRPHASLASAAP